MSANSSTWPASGAWQLGDSLGNRRLVELGVNLGLEAGGQLGGAAPITMAYEAWGELNADASNAVLVLHALTGDSHATGEAGEGHPTPGWWRGIIGPGLAIDTERFFVVAPNVLGGCQGSQGPSSTAPDGRPFGSRFPVLTPRDQVTAEAFLADALGIERFAAVVGGSMGGMRALEWAISYPERVGRLGVLSCGAVASAEQIALCSTQIAAITSSAGFAGGDYYDLPDGQGPAAAMGVARRLGHISYRTAEELSQRFGNDAQDEEDVLRGGRFAVESYLEHHAAKLANRFDANSYVVLSRSMNLHDVGRGRGGVASALGSITAPTVVVGFSTDRLYPLSEQVALAKAIPTADEVVTVRSPFGHDAFLLEDGPVGTALGRLLADA